MRFSKTTFIGICLVLITIAFSVKLISLQEFITVFGLFSGAGFWITLDTPKDEKKKPSSGLKANN